ncbi:MAG: Coq4 family protein [Pseudomonadota bacterium]
MTEAGAATDHAWRQTLRAAAEGFDAQTLAELPTTVKAVQKGDESARLALLAALWHAAARDPAATWPVYDALAQSWSGAPLEGHETPASQGVAPYTGALWPALFDVLDATRSGELDAVGVTLRVAGLATHLDTAFGGLAEATARALSGIEPHERSVTPPIRLDDLAGYAGGSLGDTLLRMLRDNGYDPEVLDRSSIGLDGLPPALRYLNTRILQTHDIWHLVAGYETTALHEIAISAFQLAQFGHNYSALFLATAVTTGAESRIEGLPILLTIISEAWRHGRCTPPLMAVDWEAHWGDDIDALREHLGVAPFSSSLPANLFELLAAAG